MDSQRYLPTSFLPVKVLLTDPVTDEIAVDLSNRQESRLPCHSLSDL